MPTGLQTRIATKHDRLAAANPNASPSTEEDFNCVKTSKDYVAMIEFHISPDEVHGFASSQLLHTSLKANPAALNDPAKPKQILKLAFSTATVVVTGSRLQFLTKPLNAGLLSVVEKLPARFAELHQDKAHVEDITVTFIE